MHKKLLIRAVVRLVASAGVPVALQMASRRPFDLEQPRSVAQGHHAQHGARRRNATARNVPWLGLWRKSAALAVAAAPVARAQGVRRAHPVPTS